MAKKLKGVRHLPQRRGRALQPGPRYASGKLKPEVITPNPVTIATRRALLGLEPSDKMTAEMQRLAENPLDLALCRQWITTAEHRAGETLASLYQRAGLDMPSMRTQDLAREIRGGSSGKGDARAMTDLREIARRLQGRPKCMAAILEVCVLGHFPLWMMRPSAPGLGRLFLIVGLRITEDALARPPVQAQGRAA